MREVLNLPTPAGRDWLEKLVFHGIVFNMSWEDPEMDRRALKLTADDTVISITSAGCNPLNFLCQSPRKLISIDGNPAQTAILELKLATIEATNYDTFFDIFGARRPSEVRRVYYPRLRGLISEKAREFWDANIETLAERGLYDMGRMAVFCRILRSYMKLVGVPLVDQDGFFDCQSLDEQNRWYHEKIAPRLWGSMGKFFVYFKPFMYLAGVHPQQFNLVDGRHDMYEYVKERVEYALTKVPIYDNYFLSMAVTGKFRGLRVPPYLLPENFPILRRNLDRVQVVNGWLGPFLDTQPAGSINKFNLLDIFDWMPAPVFESTFGSILRVAPVGSTLIYRSGSYLLEPPARYRERLTPHKELAAELFATDRSTTYGSFYIYSVNSHGRQGAEPARSPTAPATELVAS